ncbi:copper chaperone PCu(A)C [Rothia sp. LK2588]|uniref:copper chaperone PCu(A)C n=1 Tax=Rothia sp. LK2588 TaxID=3114369 RepID=UPI0034CD62BB
MKTRFKCLCALSALAVVTLTGCAGNTNETPEKADASSSASSTENQAKLTVSEPWAKASEGDMTAVFGTVKNTGDTPVTIVEATSSATGAGDTQLHTTQMDSSGASSMKQTDKFTIEPGQSLELKPGADHIMLMKLTCSMPAGTTVHMGLKTDSGEEIKFDAEARDYSGAQEKYAPGHSASASPEHQQEHGQHEHNQHELAQCGH